jgi:hypothetical protein
MQEFGLTSNEIVQFSPWRPCMPDQSSQNCFHELLIPSNILHVGNHLTTPQRPVPAYQSDRFPPSIAYKLPIRNLGSLPKLLPASADRALPRSIVVSRHDDEWLAGLLKRLKIKSKHRNTALDRVILEELLGKKEALWTLASVMLPLTSSGATLDHPSLETPAPAMLHVVGSIVYVDLVVRQEVCFKLTDETIAIFLDYHERVHCPAVTANMTNDSATEAYILAMKDWFRQAIKEFLFYTGKGCLEGTEDDGSGELCWTQPAKVKSAILALFQHPPPMSKSSTSDGTSRLDTIGNGWSAADKEGGRLASEGYWQPLVDMNFNLGL